MIAAERQNYILKRLRTDSVVSVQELAREFKTTEMTVRRDMAFLEKQGLITRAYGGAIRNEKVGFESYFASRQEERPDIKQKIAAKAAGLITDGDSIGIDVGTTAFEIARHIKDMRDLNVITASLPVLMELSNAPDIKVICTGGELSQKDLSFTGHNAINTIREYILDKVFVGVAGISFEHGYTLYNMQDTLVKRELIQRARETIIVSDSSKIGLEKYSFLCNIEAASKIITDSGISDEDRKRFESCGVEVILADVDEPAGE
ncbi:MAG TPA: DeoR/GlpR family DNA-binding transcription regulator [Pseudoflavonifractor sp.]|nr:DeoR/GlpR family DNA-binding transcription regulator [Pseudoflavonifractor sp.]